MKILDKLHALPNPFRRFNRRLARYMAITFCTGCISFATALVLLHYDFSPIVSLLLSVAASGLIGYGAMELWCFPQRSGRLSWKRFTSSSLVGGLAFLGRYGVLTLALDLFHALKPFDKILALGLAYGASFLIGYTLRSMLVFKRSASVRISASRRYESKSRVNTASMGDGADRSASPLVSENSPSGKETHAESSGCQVHGG